MDKEPIKINDSLWHPCSMDIIEHKVISIRQFEGFNHYVLKAVNRVGACGRVEVIVDEHNDTLRFVELLHEEEIQYARGLGDFIEGLYYRTYEQARVAFYTLQLSIARTNTDRYEKLFNAAQEREKQVKRLIETIKFENVRC